jgi:hypothetical protein
MARINAPERIAEETGRTVVEDAVSEALGARPKESRRASEREPSLRS